MEETHSPREAGEPQTLAPKTDKQELFVTFKETRSKVARSRPASRASRRT
jgi:hypothetical protein